MDVSNLCFMKKKKIASHARALIDMTAHPHTIYTTCLIFMSQSTMQWSCRAFKYHKGSLKSSGLTISREENVINFD